MVGDKSGYGASKWDGDNVVLFPRDETTLSTMADNARDDDELLQDAMKRITNWLAAGSMPAMTEMQEFFHQRICDGASAMLKDRVIAQILNGPR